MKKEIHPQYHSDATIKCANCGTQFDMGSTKSEIIVEICSGCHPFYTGKKVLIDTEGRVDKFRQKRESAEKNTREKKDRRKKTLEEKVNEALAEQLRKEKAKAAKKEASAA